MLCLVKKHADEEGEEVAVVPKFVKQLDSSLRTMCTEMQEKIEGFLFEKQTAL